MTPLARLLIRRIEAAGPITLADYMAECLLHPAHGYYATRDPLGVAGDFTTAPEISQMFGELVGLSLAQAWLDQGAPAPFALAELGPGRGTLMADLLRATRAVPGFHAAARLHLIEASPVLAVRQKQALAGFACHWLTETAALPATTALFAVANEFFDALPIRQFTRDDGGWRETMVGVTKGALTPGLSAVAPLAGLDHRRSDTAPGDMVETCPTAGPVMEAVGQRIARHGGAALIIDYGHWGATGATFQAVQAHAFADPFAAPGLADLTAHVDFRALARAAPTAHSFTQQGAFLTRLGITARSARLAAHLSGDRLESHARATHRLTAASEMGSLFKVLALYPQHTPPPPGMP